MESVSKRVGSFWTHLVQTRLTRLSDLNESVTKNDKWEGWAAVCGAVYLTFFSSGSLRLVLMSCRDETNDVIQVYIFCLSLLFINIKQYREIKLRYVYVNVPDGSRNRLPWGTSLPVWKWRACTRTRPTVRTVNNILWGLGSAAATYISRRESTCVLPPPYHTPTDTRSYATQKLFF